MMVLRSGLLVFTCMGHPLAAKEALIVALLLQIPLLQSACMPVCGTLRCP